MALGTHSQLVGFSFVIILLTLIFIRCSPTYSLQDYELGKLDPTLRELVESGGSHDEGLTMTIRRGGVKQYDVRITTTNPTEVRAKCQSISGGAGNLLIGYLTVEEMKKVIKLSSVQMIRVSSNKSYPQN